MTKLTLAGPQPAVPRRALQSMPGVETAPVPTRSHDDSAEGSLLTGVWNMLGNVMPPDEGGQAEFEPVRSPFISHSPAWS